jgi:hypothetical protein
MPAHRSKHLPSVSPSVSPPSTEGDTSTKISTITIVLKTSDELHPYAKLARLIRDNVAINHGRTVITIEGPDGKREHFSVYPGANMKEYDEYLAPLNWSKH